MKRICLVASDVLGVITNSGIATATTHLALVLATRGYDVTLLNTGDAQDLDETWENRYRQAGVTLEHLDRSVTVSPDYLEESYLTYQHLKQRAFDSIVLQDWLGPAFACVSAKQAGLAFQSTQIAIVTHGPTEWVREANHELKLNHRDLAVGHMERFALEKADIVVGPSVYLHNWMLDKGWRLGERRAPVPYFTAGHVADLTGMEDFRRTRTTTGSTGRLRELVFFGRLEHRKGVLLYTRALNLVDPELLRGVTLSFLGREATYSAADVSALLSPEVREAAGDPRFLTTLDQQQARAYLQRAGRVAVIPSLDDNSPNTVYECLEDRVPLVAADSGGIGELVHEEDRELCLFGPEPVALASFLTELLLSTADLPLARPAFDASASLAAWEKILGRPARAPARLAGEPLVSVVIPHHDRPELVSVTLESLERQRYPNLEVVLVDDGSETMDAQVALKLFEDREWKHPLRVVRQKNSFLGAARNTGVRHARGDLILFIDDDDAAHPDYVAAMTTAIRRTEADAVTCAFLMFEDIDGPPGEAVNTWVFLGGNLPLAATGNHLGGAGMIVRKKAWEAVGGFHEIRGLGLEDWDFLLRMLMAGLDVFAVPEALYWYRLRDDSMRLMMDRYQSHQIILDRFRNFLPEPVRIFADLAYGQALCFDEHPDKKGLVEELARRQRYQWLLERQIELLRRNIPERS